MTRGGRDDLKAGLCKLHFSNSQETPLISENPRVESVAPPNLVGCGFTQSRGCFGFRAFGGDASASQDLGIGVSRSSTLK